MSTVGIEKEMRDCKPDRNTGKLDVSIRVTFVSSPAKYGVPQARRCGRLVKNTVIKLLRPVWLTLANICCAWVRLMTSKRIGRFY
jgi:hypothetical protein